MSHTQKAEILVSLIPSAIHLDVRYGENFPELVA
jgi:hypothetical protein